MVLQMIKRKKYREILQTVSKSDLGITICDFNLWLNTMVRFLSQSGTRR